MHAAPVAGTALLEVAGTALLEVASSPLAEAVGSPLAEGLSAVDVEVEVRGAAGATGACDEEVSGGWGSEDAF